MKLEQIVIETFSPNQSLSSVLPNPDLVLVFAASQIAKDETFFTQLKQTYPDAQIAGCSTAGEITRDVVLDDSVVITEVCFDHASCKVVTAEVGGNEASFDAGEKLAQGIDQDGLKAVMIFAPGVNVNGSAILDGMTSVLGEQVAVSGGLAGDGSAFGSTCTLSTEGIHQDAITAVSFYGESLQFSYGSFGGWERFGPPRKVTKADGNILYEIDGQPALELYKTYLGDYAADLPASGLLFPLEMQSDKDGETGLIRTILGIDEAAGSLILAGDIDPNGYLRLMHTSVDGLIDGAETAASAIAGSEHTRLAVLVSCVGRKLVMGDEVTEEVEAVSQVLGSTTLTTGFYSYGEVCPHLGITTCKLHNQTMTITVISET